MTTSKAPKKPAAKKVAGRIPAEMLERAPFVVRVGGLARTLEEGRRLDANFRRDAEYALRWLYELLTLQHRGVGRPAETYLLFSALYMELALRAQRELTREQAAAYVLRTWPSDDGRSDDRVDVLVKRHRKLKREGVFDYVSDWTVDDIRAMLLDAGENK